MIRWSVYLLRCKNNALYTGICTDVARRVGEHKAGGSKAARYTRQFAPIQLVYSTPIGERSLALKVEKRIKKLPKNKKEWIVSQGLQSQALIDYLNLNGQLREKNSNARLDKNLTGG